MSNAQRPHANVDGRTASFQPGVHRLVNTLWMVNGRPRGQGKIDHPQRVDNPGDSVSRRSESIT